MALNISRLQAGIQAEMTKKIKAEFGNGPGPEQANFAKGIATGFIKTILGKTGKISGASGTGGIGKGITGLQPATVAQAIMAEMKAAFGAEGPAMSAIAEAIGKAVCDELKQASVAGTDGGTAKDFKGWSATTMGKAMFDATGFSKTDQNGKIFLAISKALTNQLMQYGKSTIPRTGTGGGPAIATIG